MRRHLFVFLLHRWRRPKSQTREIGWCIAHHASTWHEVKSLPAGLTFHLVSPTLQQRLALRRLTVKGVFNKIGLCSLMRRKHHGPARTPNRHGFQSVVSLAQVIVTSYKFPHTTGRKQILSRLICCVCMCVTSVCAYLCVRGEKSGLYIIGFDVCVK